MDFFTVKVGEDHVLTDLIRREADDGEKSKEPKIRAFRRRRVHRVLMLEAVPGKRGELANLR